MGWKSGNRGEPGGPLKAHRGDAGRHGRVSPTALILRCPLMPGLEGPSPASLARHPEDPAPGRGRRRGEADHRGGQRACRLPPPPARRAEPRPETHRPQLRRLGLAVMIGPRRCRARSSPASGGGGPCEACGEGAGPGRPAHPRPFRSSTRRAISARRRGPASCPRMPPPVGICVPGYSEPLRAPRPAALARRTSSTPRALTRSRSQRSSRPSTICRGQARRYVRWPQSGGAGAAPRRWPIRRGRRPGGRLLRFTIPRPPIRPGDPSKARFSRSTRSWPMPMCWPCVYLPHWETAR